ncbi:hypothetical protein Q5752_004363 [Cryptotrichosporon argae]
MESPSPSPRLPSLSRVSSGQTVRAAEPSPSALFARIPPKASGAAQSDSDESNAASNGPGGQRADVLALGAAGNGQAVPPSLWREASDIPFDDEEDPESGPSDYWRRPGPSSPAASPLIPFHFRSQLTGGKTAAAPDAQAHEDESSHADISIDSGFAGENGHAGFGVEDEEATDDGVFERRIQDVLDPPPASPSLSRRDKNRILSRASAATAPLAGGADSSTTNGSRPTGVYAATYREIVGERAEGEEEFGVLGTPRGSSAGTPSSVASPLPEATPSPKRPSYLHPSISRLRSHPRTVSSSTTATTPPRFTHTRTPSHFSTLSMSRSDSATSVSLPPEPALPQPDARSDAGPAFAFHPLRVLSAHLFGRDGARTLKRANSILGLGKEERELGKPTVMDVNGVIAVGTEGGYVVVYAFNQELKHVFGTESTAATAGPVTAVTVSPDQTYVAIGHTSGHIYLYDLSSPSRPARHVPPQTLRQVLSGRKEGHLEHSAIVHLGFVGKRHTSIVSGDNEGRAFWWSLGRVMGVESNDVVRMLGSYPDPTTVNLARPGTPSAPPSPGPASLDQPNGSGLPSRPSSLRSATKKATTLFAALPLPLGAPHATDTLQVAALLTPTKLVVVAMKPEPKTWFRRMRDGAGGESGGLVGCAAWLRAGEVDGEASKAKAAGKADTPGSEPSDPVLVYSWGTSVRFLRVRVGDGTPEFVEGRRWEAPSPVRALQWYDADHVLLLTASAVILLNVVSLKAVEDTPLQTQLLTSIDVYASLSKLAPAPEAFGGSVRAHRGKLFLLTRSNIQVGTLLRWSDRILALVHTGDFLGAIRLALAYYLNTAPGNGIGLPADTTARDATTAARVRELVVASLDWAFSEDRMRDDTHFSADGRGVDLTALFERLAAACVAVCAALGDGRILYDDAWEHFSGAGIHGILLRHLEPAFFEGTVPSPPPHIIQALIRAHEVAEEWELAEAVIWHADRSSLDIDLALRVCEARRLWDALIWVWEAMGDYIAPLVRLLRAVRDDDDDGEAAYKLYAYLDAVLSGLSYPSLSPLEDAAAAQSAAYGFVFSDRPMSWPAGGEVVHTTQGAEHDEPAYPYLRALMQLDLEAFLHALDGAFEHSYLNTDAGVVNRQSILTLMLDLVDPAPLRPGSPSSPGLEPGSAFNRADRTLLHIFVARNLPKYPQFIFLPPTTLRRILGALCADPDPATTEDRQLAAESLLGAYTPDAADDATRMYERAGFWRILRRVYERDREWDRLVRVVLAEGEAGGHVYAELERVAALSQAGAGTGVGSTDGAARARAVETAVRENILALLDGSVRQTALTLDRAFPHLHADALARLAPHKQRVYLGLLVDPADDDPPPSSARPPVELRHTYAALLAALEPASLVAWLDRKGPGYFDLPKLARQAEDNGAIDAAVWALSHSGQTDAAACLAEQTVVGRGADACDALRAADEGAAWAALGAVRLGVRVGVGLCRDAHDADDRWYAVLRSLTDVVQAVSALDADGAGHADGPDTRARLVADAHAELDALVSETLAELSTAHVAFPALFARLVGPVPSASASQQRARYADFRPILAGMLGSYAHRADVLGLAVKMVATDAADDMVRLVGARSRGLRAWKAGQTCACGRAVEGESGFAVGPAGVVCCHCAGRSVSQA